MDSNYALYSSFMQSDIICHYCKKWDTKQMSVNRRKLIRKRKISESPSWTLRNSTATGKMTFYFFSPLFIFQCEAIKLRANNKGLADCEFVPFSFTTAAALQWNMTCRMCNKYLLDFTSRLHDFHRGFDCLLGQKDFTYITFTIPMEWK